MSRIHTQLDIHLVLAVKGRQSLIQQAWRDELYDFIVGMVQNQGHEMLSINGMPDHLHLFISYNPAQSIPHLVQAIQTTSQTFIKDHNFSRFPFNWQDGYGAFSYGRSQREAMMRYIDKQEDLHQKKTFREEYLEMLGKFEVAYEEGDLFYFLEVKTW